MTSNLPVSKFTRLLDRCPEVYDEEELMAVAKDAQQAYMDGEVAGPAAMAKRFPKLPFEVCRQLIDTFGWRDMRVRHLEDLQAAAAVDYAEFIRETRKSVAKNLVDQLGPAIKTLTEEISTSLSHTSEADKYRTMDARRLAEAVAQLADKLMKAAGIDGNMPAVPEQAEKGKDQAKRPWVSITASGPVAISSGDGQKPEHGASDNKQEKTDERDDYSTQDP